MVSITQSQTVVDSAEINFHCPSCEGVNNVDVFRFKTSEKLYGLVTVNVTSETALKCPGCNTTFRTADLITDLMQLDENLASKRFRPRVTFPDKFMVIAGWIIFMCGPMSLVLFLIAWFRIPKAATRWRRAALVGGILSLVATLLLILPLALGEN